MSRQEVSLADVTPLVLTCNEEYNIDRVLQKLRWAQRIVVVDSFSTDGTLGILRSHPQVELFHRTFDNHTNQWNYGLQQVTSPWVLTLDADYVLGEGFVEAMEQVLRNPAADGFFARFRYCISGKPLRGSLYPPRLVLFRRERGTYVPDGHTQLLQLDGRAAELASYIYHDDRKPLSRWLHAQNRYLLLEAEKLYRTPSADLNLADRLRQRYMAPFAAPLYCLFGRGLVFDGRAGLHYTFQRTYSELLLALRLLDRALQETDPAPVREAKQPAALRHPVDHAS